MVFHLCVVQSGAKKITLLILKVVLVVVHFSDVCLFCSCLTWTVQLGI